MRVPLVLTLCFLAFAAHARDGAPRFSNSAQIEAGLGHVDPAVVCPGLLAQAEERGDARAVLAHDELAVDAHRRLVPQADIARPGWRALPEAGFADQQGGSVNAILVPPEEDGILLTPDELETLCGAQP